MTDPKTLTEAVNLGKGYGIDTAETILALVVAELLEDQESNRFAILNKVVKSFNKKCDEYKSQLTKPVTEEEKRKLLNQE